MVDKISFRGIPFPVLTLEDEIPVGKIGIISPDVARELARKFVGVTVELSSEMRDDKVVVTCHAIWEIGESG